MKKKHLDKLVLNRETLRELSVEETRKVAGGFSLAESDCDMCAPARGRIPVG
jgi:hypothetical protein